MMLLYDETTEEIILENDDSTESSSQDSEVITLLKSIDGKLERALPSEDETTEDTTEEVTTEETTEETTEAPVLTFLDETVDNHLYLTSQVENATVNDLYTIGLSIRNILLLFMLFWLGLKIFGMLRSVLYRLMNK